MSLRRTCGALALAGALAGADAPAPSPPDQGTQRHHAAIAWELAPTGTAPPAAAPTTAAAVRTAEAVTSLPSTSPSTSPSIRAPAPAPAPASAPPSESLALMSATFAGRVSYLLADGQHPFVDADARRVLLGFELRSAQSERILGWRDLTVAEAVSDAGEPLTVTFPHTQGEQLKGAKHLDLQIGLPAGAKSYHGLRRLRGQLAVVFEAGPSAVAYLPARAVVPAGVAIDGHQELQLRAESGGGGGTAIRLSRDAALAVVDIVACGADHKPLGPRARRERRGATGEDGTHAMIWAQALPENCVLEITYLPTRVQRMLAFDLKDLAFGVEVPDAASQRAGEPRGADEL